jgi:hypothetical protein
MRRTLSAVLTLSLVFAGCKAKEAYDQAKIAQDLNKRGTMDLMKEVSNDHYTPPADGKLTDAQIKMYLKVRDHEKQIAQVARKEAEQHAEAAKKAGDQSLAGMMEGFKTIGSAAEMMTADIRAAKDLGYNTQEYLWVKTQLLAVSGAELTAKMGQAMNAQMDASYAQMKKSYDEAKDDQTKATYKQILDGMEKTRAEAQTKNASAETAALAYNRQLISKYDNVLNAAAAEMGKFESKDGEAQKSMDDLSKNLDKAVQDSKKP